jgi:hypothetical protein
MAEFVAGIAVGVVLTIVGAMYIAHQIDKADHA